MKIKLILATLLLQVAAFAQKTTEAFESKKLGVTRSISVVLPQGYDQDKNKKYPIFVVQDGDYLLDLISSNIRYGAYWDEYPDFIFVGINQGKDRKNDTTFDQNGLPAEGGASYFEFIGMELLPYIESKYRTIPYRVIAGHGLTAAFQNAYLYKDTSIFNGYINLSPEMPTEMENRVGDRFKALNAPIFYFLAQAEGDLKQDKAQIQKLDANIKALKKENIYYNFVDYKGYNHYSYVNQAVPDALQFMFKGYERISMEEFQAKIATLEKGHTQYLVDRYATFKKKTGYAPQIRLTDFEAIEAAILKNQNFEDLKTLADIADKEYPKTMLGAYHRALYEEKMNDFDRAYKAYMKAFQLEPVRNLTKELMVDRAEFFKKELKNYKDKRKNRGNEPEEPISETPSEGVADTPLQ